MFENKSNWSQVQFTKVPQGAGYTIKSVFIHFDVKYHKCYKVKSQDLIEVCLELAARITCGQVVFCACPHLNVCK